MSSKWKDRGYWVSNHFYWQSLIHYLYNCARFRSLTFFSAANPAIPFGGMLDDKKSEIDHLIPIKYRPKTVSYDPIKSLESQLTLAGIKAPFIIKPDVGLKGFKVRYIENIEEAKQFLKRQDATDSWILQSYIKHAREFSILFYNNPLSKEYGVTSLIEKQYPFVTGDGHLTLKSLVKQYNNPFVDTKWLMQKWKNQLNNIIPKGKKLIIDNIGNYSRGSSFHSLMSEVTPQLIDRCKTLLDDFEGIHFYRMDFKADSLEDFMSGNFMVIEINGAKGEPLHIYDKKHSFWSNIKDIRKHWKVLSDIVISKHNAGYKFPGNIDGLKALKSLKQVG